MTIQPIDLQLPLMQSSEVGKTQTAGQTQPLAQQLAQAEQQVKDAAIKEQQVAQTNAEDQFVNPDGGGRGSEGRQGTQREKAEEDEKERRLSEPDKGHFVDTLR